MKQRKLKGYVLPTIYAITLVMMIISIAFLSQNLLASQEERNPINSEPVFDEQSVINETTEEQTTNEVTIAMPYTSDKVSVAKDYYNREDDSENQEKSLIFYENTYMPNTGILYESDETFDVVTILDGTIKEVKEDEILGKMVSIEHENGIISTYYTLGEIKVSAGDQVKQNDIIATSGTSKLNINKQSSLLLEIYIDGNLTNPNTIFNKKVSEITESP